MPYPYWERIRTYYLTYSLFDVPTQHLEDPSRRGGGSAVEKSWTIPSARDCVSHARGEKGRLRQRQQRRVQICISEKCRRDVAHNDLCQKAISKARIQQVLLEVEFSAQQSYQPPAPPPPLPPPTPTLPVTIVEQIQIMNYKNYYLQ